MRSILLRLKDGWKPYIESRFQGVAQESEIKVEPHQIDGLSFPMTLLQIL